MTVNSPAPPPSRPALGGLRIALLAGCLLVATLLPGTASAAPTRGLLVVEGAGNSVTELVLKQDVLLRASALPSFAGGGDYAGVLIEQLGAPEGPVRRIGGVQVRAFRDGTRDAVAAVGADSQLPAGRYRVTLLGDGPVRASLRMADENAAGLRVEPRTRILVRFFGRADPLKAERSDTRIDLGRSLPAGRRALQVGLLQGTHVEELRMCATTAPECERTPTSLSAGLDGTSMAAVLVNAAPEDRSMLWSAKGLRTEDDRLRAAAIVF